MLRDVKISSQIWGRGGVHIPLNSTRTVVALPCWTQWDARKFTSSQLVPCALTLVCLSPNVNQSLLADFLLHKNEGHQGQSVERDCNLACNCFIHYMDRSCFSSQKLPHPLLSSQQTALWDRVVRKKENTSELLGGFCDSGPGYVRNTICSDVLKFGL